MVVASWPVAGRKRQKSTGLVVGTRDASRGSCGHSVTVPDGPIDAAENTNPKHREQDSIWQD